MSKTYSSAALSIDQCRLNRYATLSGGTGQIHTDPEYAKDTIFKRTLIHGIYLITLIEKELNNLIKSEDNKELENYQVKSTFIKPVFSDEEFTIQLTHVSNSQFDYKVIKIDGSESVIGEIILNY